MDRGESRSRALLVIGCALAVGLGLALSARTIWDDGYQAAEGGMIGQPVAYFLLGGVLAGGGVSLFVSWHRTFLVVVATVLVTTVNWLAAGLGDGFINLGVGSLVLALVVGCLGSLVGVGLAWAVGRGTRRGVVRGPTA